MNKIWLKAAAIRAVRSFAQGALAALGTGAAFTTVDWLTVLSTAALAALVSVLMSLAGLPEAKPDIMAGAGETFDLCGADRPGKCVGSIAEIMEGMGIGNATPPSPTGSTPDDVAPDNGIANAGTTDTGTPNDEAPPASSDLSRGKYANPSDPGGPGHPNSSADPGGPANPGGPASLGDSTNPGGPASPDGSSAPTNPTPPRGRGKEEASDDGEAV